MWGSPGGGLILRRQRTIVTLAGGGRPFWPAEVPRRPSPKQHRRTRRGRRGETPGPDAMILDMETALSLVTVISAALATFFAWRTVRLGVRAAREAKWERTERHLDRLAVAVESIHESPLSTDPSPAGQLARDRLDFALMGLNLDLPQTWELTQLLGRNRAVESGVLASSGRVDWSEIRRQCVKARTEIQLKHSLLFTQMGDVPDVSHSVRQLTWWQRHRGRT
jgi:hypothetical protein